MHIKKVINIKFATTVRRPVGLFLIFCIIQLASTTSISTALILYGIDSTRYRRHCSEIVVHVDMTSSHSFTDLLPAHPQCESDAIWVQWTHFHVKKQQQTNKETVLNHFLLETVVIRRWMDMVSNKSHVSCGVKWCLAGTNGPRMCQENILHQTEQLL